MLPQYVFFLCMCIGTCIELRLLWPQYLSTCMICCTPECKFIMHVHHISLITLFWGCEWYVSLQLQAQKFQKLIYIKGLTDYKHTHIHLHFVYRLFHGDFPSIVGQNPSYTSTCIKVNQVSKKLCNMYRFLSLKQTIYVYCGIKLTSLLSQ